MMEIVGLIPSDTGQPGGNKVGQGMSHYSQPNGAFDVHCRQLVKQGVNLAWGDSFGNEETNEDEKPKKGRVKYTCSTCELNAWAKQDIVLICGECQEILQVQD